MLYLRLMDDDCRSDFRASLRRFRGRPRTRNRGEHGSADRGAQDRAIPELRCEGCARRLGGAYLSCASGGTSLSRGAVSPQRHVTDDAPVEVRLIVQRAVKGRCESSRVSPAPASTARSPQLAAVRLSCSATTAEPGGGRNVPRRPRPAHRAAFDFAWTMDGRSFSMLGPCTVVGVGPTVRAHHIYLQRSKRLCGNEYDLWLTRTSS
jgi:hypothetical protein